MSALGLFVIPLAGQLARGYFNLLEVDRVKKRVRTLKDHVMKRGIYGGSILVVDSQVADHLIKVKAAELVTEKATTEPAAKTEAPKEKPKKKKTSKVNKDGE